MPLRRAKQTFVDYCRESCDMACIELAERQLLEYYRNGTYKVRNVKGDRNCMYRALSAGIHNTETFYRQVRESIYRELQERYAHYESVFQKFADATLSTELDVKSTLDPTWGDSVVALIAANALSRPIMIVTVTENGTKVESFVPEGADCALGLSLVLELQAQHYRAVTIDKPDAVMLKAAPQPPPPRRPSRLPTHASGRLLDLCHTNRDCNSSMGHYCENKICVDDAILADLPVVPEPARKTVVRFQLPDSSSLLSLDALRKCQSSSQCDAELGLFCDRGMCVNDLIYNQVRQQNNLEDS